MMKKFWIMLFTLLLSRVLLALPVGNPSDPSLLREGIIWEGCDAALCYSDAFSVRVGYYGDFVYNKHMKTISSDAIIETTQIRTDAAYLVLNFCNWWDFFCTLGASNLYINTNSRTFRADFPNNPLGNRIFLEYATTFSWSVGMRCVLWECGCTSLGAEAQYFLTNTPLQRLIQRSSGGFTFNNDQLNTRYREMQLGVGLSHRFRNLIPYVALKVNDTRISFSQSTLTGVSATFFNLENYKSWGLAVGTSLVACDSFSLTVEGRYFEETALYVNGQLRF